MNIKITKGNISDLKVTNKLAKNLYRKLSGDKGYISKSLYKDILALFQNEWVIIGIIHNIFLYLFKKTNFLFFCC